MVKETTKSFEEFRIDDNFRNVWDKTATVSENNSFSEPKLSRIQFRFISIKFSGSKKQITLNK